MRLLPVRKSNPYFPMMTLFDDFVDRCFDNDHCQKGVMPMDIVELPDHYEIRANLPGIRKEDISITGHKNQLVIEAKQENQQEEKKDGRLVYYERYQGNYQRSVLLPDDCEVEKIKARMENGILTLTVPKGNRSLSQDIVIE